MKEPLPSLLGQPEYAAAGELVAYGPTVAEVYQRTAVHADRIPTVSKPADLTVEQPTNFRLIMNMKTAKALGLTSPWVGAAAGRRAHSATAVRDGSHRGSER